MTNTEARNRLKQFIQEKCVLHGEFQLASGGTSNTYLDCRRISDGYSLSLAATVLRSAILEREPTTSVVGCMASGPNMMTVATMSPPILDTTIVYKDNGTLKIANCQSRGVGVAVIEDVVSTGGSVTIAINELIRVKNIPTLLVALVDREMGGLKKVEESFGIPAFAIFRISELLTN